MTGGVGADGVSWCPDCDAARPSIRSNILEKTQLKVLKGVVEERNTWVGVADHPFKKHPVIKAGGVPSVCLVQGDIVMARAESEDDFENLALLEMISNGE